MDRSRLTRLAGSGMGLVALGTLIGVLAVVGITVFGLGAPAPPLTPSSLSAWLFSSSRGEVARVNGATGRVDYHYQVIDTRGHQVVVTQNDDYLILRDVSTGMVSSIDPTTLRVAAIMHTTPGPGVTLAIYAQTAVIIDSVLGWVRQLDPLTLEPVGDPLRFPRGITGGVFDGAGICWMVVPSQGEVVGMRTASRNAAPTRPGPTVARRIAVGAPGDVLTFSVLDSGVAVLDQTAGRLLVASGYGTTVLNLPPGAATGILPTRSSNDAIPITVPTNRTVYLVDGTNIAEISVPSSDTDLAAAVPFAGRLYIADNSTGTVYVLDRHGEVTDEFTIDHAGGPLEFLARGGRLFISAPGAATARIVSGDHEMSTVDKYTTAAPRGGPSR